MISRTIMVESGLGCRFWFKSAMTGGEASQDSSVTQSGNCSFVSDMNGAFWLMQWIQVPSEFKINRDETVLWWLSQSPEMAAMDFLPSGPGETLQPNYQIVNVHHRLFFNAAPSNIEEPLRFSMPLRNSSCLTLSSAMIFWFEEFGDVSIRVSPGKS